ncbi:hypothetical protein E4Q23_05690 [Candidatus Accumulibacter phosphatis]|jgi:HPt (histidine-containing phosphotransfer) domain-containing protein|uniref:HPt domain-containing protein n=1 Tax=Candidatus Accumulibacter phosphatis TaxID=327160 RepID=A0ABX1TV37_9PROT|nr:MULTISPECIES: Hpt domain-containing protein [Candidatus Accumulibacter]NMQ27291.1 hypothetical protein [Candidatus Accumulibacter phosphatis]
MPELPAAAAAQLAAQLAELGEEFQRSLPARVGQIEAAVKALGASWTDCADVAGREGWEAALRELSAAAHRLAGAAGTFDHPALGATALQMEALARQLQAEPAARVVGSASARETFARLLATLKAAVDAAPLLISTTVGAESVGGLAAAPALRPAPVLVVGDDE